MAIFNSKLLVYQRVFLDRCSCHIPFEISGHVAGLHQWKTRKLPTFVEAATWRSFVKKDG